MVETETETETDPSCSARSCFCLAQSNRYYDPEKGCIGPSNIAFRFAAEGLGLDPAHVEAMDAMLDPLYVHIKAIVQQELRHLPSAMGSPVRRKRQVKTPTSQKSGGGGRRSGRSSPTVVDVENEIYDEKAWYDKLEEATGIEKGTLKHSINTFVEEELWRFPVAVDWGGSGARSSKVKKEKGKRSKGSTATASLHNRPYVSRPTERHGTKLLTPKPLKLKPLKPKLLRRN